MLKTEPALKAFKYVVPETLCIEKLVFKLCTKVDHHVEYLEGMYALLCFL